MLAVGGILFVSGILTHCMCQTTDRAAEASNDIVPIEPVSDWLIQTTDSNSISSFFLVRDVNHAHNSDRITILY